MLSLPFIISVLDAAVVRPLSCQIHGLSFYEFARHYQMKQARHPLTAQVHEAHMLKPELYEAKLTDAGILKVSSDSSGFRPKLLAGLDYEIRKEGGEGWCSLGQSTHAQPYRHDWVIARRKRPYVPVIYGAQGSKTDQEQAMRLLVLFFPWVNDPQDATREVPFIGDFWEKDMKDWRHALRARVWKTRGFPTEEVRRYVLDFCFVYFLPRGLALQDDLAPNSDNEVEADDGILELDQDDLEDVILTHVRGAGSKGAAGDDGEESEEEKPSTTLHDLTMDMFQRSNAIWLASDRLTKADPAATKVYTEMQAAPPVRDHVLAQHAAKTSAIEGDKGQNTHRRPHDAEGSVRSLPPLTKQILEEFLRGDRLRKSTNQKQREFLELVVDRIMVELGLMSKEASKRKSDEPLRWLLHGPPGTGKSHVLRFVKELFYMMGYTFGLDFEVVSFQTVNAADLGGKTIHHAFGFGQFHDLSIPCNRDVAKRMAHWRWLVIDEISLRMLPSLARLSTGFVRKSQRQDAGSTTAMGG